jgi:hypothetical protein
MFPVSGPAPTRHENKAEREQGSGGRHRHFHDVEIVGLFVVIRPVFLIVVPGLAGALARGLVTWRAARPATTWRRGCGASHRKFGLGFAFKEQFVRDAGTHDQSARRARVHVGSEAGAHDETARSAGIEVG